MTRFSIAEFPLFLFIIINTLYYNILHTGLVSHHNISVMPFKAEAVVLPMQKQVSVVMVFSFK